MANRTEPPDSAENEIAAAKRELRAHGWYVRYTEWPTGHQVVIHLRSDTAIHLVTPWFPTEPEAWREALSLAARHPASRSAEPEQAGTSPGAPSREGGEDVRGANVVVVGGAALELAVRAPRLPEAGETVGGDLLQQGPAGKGATRAIAAARLGARVALIARIGGDPRGDEVLARLRADGVDVEAVSRDPDAPTAVALAHIDRRGRRSDAVLADGGASGRLSPSAMRAAAERIGRAAVFLASLDVPAAAVAEALRVARSRGAQTLLDAATARRVPERLLRLSDVVRVSAPDAERVTGVRVRGRRSALSAAKMLLRRGAGAVVIDSTREGAVVVTRSEIIWIPAAPVRHGDREAPGASFCAAFAVGLAEGRELEDACRLACTAASLTAANRRGLAGLPTRAELSRAASATPAAEDLILDGILPADAPLGARERNGQDAPPSTA